MRNGFQLFGLLGVLACGEAETEKEDVVLTEGMSVGDCTDGADNDGDGAFDCDDDGCAGSPDCQEDTGDTPDDTDDTEDTDDSDTDDTDVELDPLDVDDDGDGFSENDGDCDDSTTTIGPEALDAVGDDVDQNCDGIDGVDADGDGYPSVISGGTDCDDDNMQTFPGATDFWYDGIDSDCSGGSDYDQDGDGDDSIQYGGGDCDDMDASVSSNFLDQATDGIDQNCDGVDGVDADGDGFADQNFGGLDCDDMNASVNPNAGEDYTNNLDDDCDGFVDIQGAVCSADFTFRLPNGDTAVMDGCVDWSLDTIFNFDPQDPPWLRHFTLEFNGTTAAGFECSVTIEQNNVCEDGYFDLQSSSNSVVFVTTDCMDIPTQYEDTYDAIEGFLRLDTVDTGNQGGSFINQPLLTSIGGGLFAESSSGLSIEGDFSISLIQLATIDEETSLCEEEDIADVDYDGDGDEKAYFGGSDCDDNNANLYTGAAVNEPGLCVTDDDGDGWGDSYLCFQDSAGYVVTEMVGYNSFESTYGVQASPFCIQTGEVIWLSNVSDCVSSSSWCWNADTVGLTTVGGDTISISDGGFTYHGQFGSDCDAMDASLQSVLDDLDCDGILNGLDSDVLVQDRQLSFAYATGCLLDQNQEIVCWGEDYHGQVSNVPSGSFLNVSVGDSGTVCAVNLNNEIECWGQDSHGQISNVPEGSFMNVAVGSNHVCALDLNNELVCWGRNNNSQVTDTPNGRFHSLVAWSDTSCALSGEGQKVCWGGGRSQEDLIQSSANCNLNRDYEIVCIDTLDTAEVPAGTFMQIDSMGDFACALDTLGGIQCWGDDSHGQVTDVPTGTYLELAVSAENACAINDDGNLYCWGRDHEGQVSNAPIDVVAYPFVDADQDGAAVQADCDDTDPNVAWISRDTDCDGAAWDIDCDDNDASNSNTYCEICNDGLENDSDGLIDCADPECFGLQFTDADGNIGLCDVIESDCSDGFDNDGNGLADCADPMCLGFEITTQSSYTGDYIYCDVDEGGSTCFDGFDNDGDGLSDCADPSCFGVSGSYCYGAYECSYQYNTYFLECESTETVCNDGLDNDGNGLIDCEEPACDGQSAYEFQTYTCEYGSEVSCEDGADNDNDGLVDCADPDCGDLDCDGFLSADDCDDTDAAINPDATEVWYDGVDQNCDGLSDYDQDGDGELSDQYGGMDCNDTDSAYNTTAVETCNGLDLNCDGVLGWTTGYWVSPTQGCSIDLVQADLVIENSGTYSTASLTKTEVISDVDADGSDDLVVWFNNDLALFSSTQMVAGGMLDVTDATVLIDVGKSSYNGSVTSIPDINGDGLAELAVTGLNVSNVGSVLIYYSTTLNSGNALTNGDADITISGEANDNGGFGSGIQSLPDLDNDGAPELGVTSFNYGDTNVGVGRAVIFSSSDLAAGVDLMVSDAMTVIENTVEGDGIAHIDVLGDINGDGISEFGLSSIPSYSYNISQFYIFSGVQLTTSSSLLTSDAYITLTNNHIGDGFGYDLTVSDLDSDGYSDLLITVKSSFDVFDSQYNYYSIGSYSSRAYLVLGNAISGGGSFDMGIAHTTIMADTFDGFGNQVLNLQDVDGDGIDDFLMSAPFYHSWCSTSCHEGPGEAFVFSGADLLVGGQMGQTDAFLQFIEEDHIAGFGGFDSMSSGDLNGDGNLDLVFLTPSQPDYGKVYIFSGL